MWIWSAAVMLLLVGILVGAAAHRFAVRRLRPSQRAAAYNALEMLFDAVPAIINCKDLNGHYVLMNAYQARLYGTTSNMAVGKTAEELLGRSHGGYSRDLERQVIATGESIEFIEEAYPDAQGVMHDWCTTFVPLKDQSGQVGHIGAIAVDITEQKAIERELLMAKEAAEYATRTKSEFLANMSHELRTPLNAILGFSEIMKQELFGALGSSTYRAYADDIHESGVLLLQVINDILDLSKAEAGKIELHEETVDIRHLVESMIRLVRPRAEAGRLALQTCTENLSHYVHADERLMKQILLNMLTNAIKFTPANGRILVEAGVATDSEFMLSVTDTGIGIAAEDIPRVMQPFGQIENALSRTHQGTGLGLPLIKSLVELHGGHLVLKSTKGVGTRITAILPATRVIEIETNLARVAV